MQGYQVDLQNGNPQDFHVTFYGPQDTPYEGSVLRVHVGLPENYPFSSPSIGFEPNSIYHPNIDERSGSVCLDVINQTWTPLYSLVNVFEVFLPQLLTYPNVADPLNPEAAQIYQHNEKLYHEKIRSRVEETIRRDRERRAKEDSTGASTSTISGGSNSLRSASDGTNSHTVGRVSGGDGSEESETSQMAASVSNEDDEDGDNAAFDDGMDDEFD